jgi:hypothetical protein
MPAAPRASNKAKDIAYNILGVPACLNDDYKREPKTREAKTRESKTDGHLRIPQNDSDSRRPGV